MPLSDDVLKQLLVSHGVVNEEDFELARREAVRSGISLTRLFISRGQLTQKYLNELIGTFLNIPLFDIRANPFVPEIVELLPDVIARQRQVLVIRRDEEKNTYAVAMLDPTDVENISFLKEYLKGEISPSLATPEDLRFGFRFYKRKASEHFETLIAERIKVLRTSLARGTKNILENVPLVQFFDTLIDYAAILGASDVFFQPEEEFLKVRFRVDGLLRDVLTVDKSIIDGVVARVKALSSLRIDEHLRPQDGRFRFHSSDVDLDIRSAVMPTFFGEKVSLRLLPGRQSFLTFDELGMNPKVIAKLQNAMKRPYGMILSSGPTGSGKTTSIYAILALLNRPEVHITTIEDPVEYLMRNVSQTQVNVQAEVTFASGLRALLRHSPDIIFIGEIRDAETSNISVNAALTGHLLISTIHTNDAPSAVVRLANLGVPPFLVSATLNVVLAQRLIRRVCLSCIESYSPSEATMKSIREEARRRGIEAAPPAILFRGKGCSVCGGTGYEGRVGIFEIFIVDEKVRDLINRGTVDLDTLHEAAAAQGMSTMFEDGLEKAAVGATTVEEVLRAIGE